jgi:dolichol-phosphate mannosyltransferase
VLERLAATASTSARAELVHPTPADIAERYRTRRRHLRHVVERASCRLRPPAQPRGPARLYLVGGSSHPGGGLPLVTMSATDRGRHDRRRISGDEAPCGMNRASDGYGSCSWRYARRRRRRVAISAARQGGQRRAPPIRPTLTPLQTISGRDPCTRRGVSGSGRSSMPIIGAPGVAEVIVVDDQSSDDDGGHRTTPPEPPWSTGTAAPGRVGGQGMGVSSRASRHATLGLGGDARCRRATRPPSADGARRAGRRRATAPAHRRADVSTARRQASRWLHPAMLTTLVYRFGPPGAAPSRPDRTMANGQCMAIARTPLPRRQEGWTPVRGDVVEDHLPGTTPRRRRGDRVRLPRRERDAQRAHVRVVARCLVRVGAIVRAARRRAPGSPARRPGRGRVWRKRCRSLGCSCAAATCSTSSLAALASRHPRGHANAHTTARTPTYWLSPLADPVAAIAIAGGIASRRRQTWRGRSYS